MTATEFREQDLTGARFERVSLRGASFTDLSLNGAANGVRTRTAEWIDRLLDGRRCWTAPGEGTTTRAPRRS